MSVEETAAELGLTGPLAGIRFKLWAITQLLTPFLCNPEQFPIHVCAGAVVKLTRRLLPPDEEFKTCFRLLRTEHRSCLDELVRFAAIPRTDEQLRNLETRLNQCRCDLATYEILQLVHDNDNDVKDLTFKGLVSSVFTTLARITMYGLKVGHVVGGQPVAEPDFGKKWPENAAALFPAGPEAAVVSFARFFRSTNSPAILDFIRTVLPHCPSLAVPISSSALLWEVVVEGLQGAVEDCGASFVINEDDEGEESSGPEQIIWAFSMFLQTFISTFIDSVRRNLASSVLASCGRRIHDLLLNVLLMCKDSPNQAKLEGFCFIVAGVAIAVVKAVPERQRPRRMHPVIMAYALQAQSSAREFIEVFGSLSRLTAVAQCCNAGCMETSESSAQKLRYCARCRVMRYCSSSCQKTAWRHHKNVCTDLETLNTKVMPELDSCETDAGSARQVFVKFEKEARKLSFTEDRMKELAKELTPFLHLQNLCKSAAPTAEIVSHSQT
ncbi:hypothetical protein GGX14DRAFT_646597 [Mycena pura]|uniref:MYND-type domain-containing protein n=1 Tax=Mycena pura TaxID=153505 RepID=A0AAD6V948_9AGAR|nr:hypothetical protein GGX14DRAFT_646597 [Mycena pura]